MDFTINGDTPLRNRKNPKATANGHLNVVEESKNESEGLKKSLTEKLNESLNKKLHDSENELELENEQQKPFVVGFEIDLMTLVLLFLAVATRFYKLSEPKNIV